MEKIGEEKVRTRVIIEEPKIRIEEIYTETYVCPSCRQDGEDVLFKTEAPLPVIPHSFASAEAIAHVASERLSKRTLQPAGEGVEMAGSLHQPENDVQLDHGGLRTLS